MKEFIEKLIGRLEEKKNLFAYKCVDYAEGLADAYEQSINIVNQLAEEYRNDKVCQTAIMYAENLHKYGVQIDSIWETATQQSMALNQAYMRGRQDERDIFDEWQEEYINTSTDTSSGWIACSERLPEEGVDVLVWFEYYRYGSYNRLYQTTGISFTYNGEWSGFVNGSSGWSQLSIIAWQPLPAPYKE